MTESAQRNIEDIRRKNLEDNQLFLTKLRMSNIRNDFINSARSILHKDKPKKKPPLQHEKVDRVTRYSLKVKSGEIKPWKKTIKRRKKSRPSKWTLFYKSNANPYQRTFKPRHSKIDE